MLDVKMSILMGVYNCEDTLQESIDSILCQTFKDWELIICDDGSVDSTREIANEYVKNYPNKIYLLENGINKGLNFTLNKCFTQAKGKYISRQDGDDISIPTRLQKLNDFLDQNPSYSIVSSKMIYFDENGEFGDGNVKLFPNKKDFLFGAPFCHAASMFTKEAFIAVNGYTISNYLLRVEDYDLWTKMYAKGYIGANIDEALYKMRDDRNAYSRRKYKYRINETIALFKGYKRLNIKLPFYIFIIKPLIVGLLPDFLYKNLHKLKVNANS
jgi:glycosyltransferase EpsE